MRNERYFRFGVLGLALGALALAPSMSTAGPAQSTLADQAQKVFDETVARYQAGTATVDDVIRWSERVYDADHAQSTFEARAKSVDAVVQKRVAAGLSSQHDALASTYHVLEAQSSRK